MRPHYETKHDVRIEDVIAELFARHLNLQQAKLDAKQYRIDRAALQGKTLVGLFEIKTRRITHNQYPAYMLSAAKFRDGVNWSKYGLWFALVVSFLDGVYYYMHHDAYLSQVKYELNGRTDRNDLQDIEPLAMIPLDLFQGVPLNLAEKTRLYAAMVNRK